MFHEQSYNINEVATPLLDSRKDLTELKNTIKKWDPDKEIEELKKRYHNSARILEQLRQKRENQFSQIFIQGIEWQPWEEELVCLLAQKNPLFAIPLFANYQDKPYAQKALGIAMESAFHESPEIALLNLHLYNNKEHIEKLIIDLFERDKSELFLFYRNIVEKDSIFMNWSEILFSVAQEVILWPENIRNFFQKFMEYFNWKEITIGKKTIILKFPANINLFSWLLKTFDQESNDIASNKAVDRSSIKTKYEGNLSMYIKKWAEISEINKERNHVFVVRASWDDDHNGAIGKNNSWIRNYYKWLTIDKNYIDYSSDINPTEPSKIIDNIQNTIRKNPNDQIYIHIWLHWSSDGSAQYTGGRENGWGYEGWSFTKGDFNDLYNLRAKYPWHVHIDIESCYSGNKNINKDHKIKNISMWSWKQASEEIRSRIFLDAFENKDNTNKFYADYDEDGIVNYNEAMIFVMEHYNDSLTPTSFDYNGQAIDISMKEQEGAIPTG